MHVLIGENLLTTGSWSRTCRVRRVAAVRADKTPLAATRRRSPAVHHPTGARNGGRRPHAAVDPSAWTLGACTPTHSTPPVWPDSQRSPGALARARPEEAAGRRGGQRTLPATGDAAGCGAQNRWGREIRPRLYPPTGVCHLLPEASFLANLTVEGNGRPPGQPGLSWPNSRKSSSVAEVGPARGHRRDAERHGALATTCCPNPPT